MGNSKASACMNYHASCSGHVAALFMDIEIIRSSSHQPSQRSDLTANPPS